MHSYTGYKEVADALRAYEDARSAAIIESRRGDPRIALEDILERQNAEHSNSHPEKIS